MLDDPAHAGNIEDTNVTISKINAVLHKHTVSIMELRLHTLTGNGDDLVSAGDHRTVKQMILPFPDTPPVGAITGSSMRPQSDTIHAVIGGHEFSLVGFLVHGFGKVSRSSFPTCLKTGNSQQDHVLLCKERADPFKAEELIGLDIQNSEHPIEKLWIRTGKAAFPVPTELLEI